MNRKLTGKPVRPGEVRQPHPTIPSRDSLGRMVKVAEDRHNEDFLRLRSLMHEALSPEELKMSIRELYKLCLPGEHGFKVQLEAIHELHDRFFGKAASQVNVTKNETSTTTL